MPRPQGLPKTGKRQVGASNQSVWLILYLLEQIKINPVKEILLKVVKWE